MPKSILKKIRVGNVEKKSGINTVTVNVKDLVRHPVYKKVCQKNKKYMVHSEGYDVVIGDTVEIIECRPLSKRKTWRINNIVNPK